MDTVLKSVGKDCFGLIMEYAAMNDEFSKCITQLKKTSVIVDIRTCYFNYHDEYFFEEDAEEYYYPYNGGRYPENSYVEFPYFMYELKCYNTAVCGNNFSINILSILKMIKKLKVPL